MTSRQQLPKRLLLTDTERGGDPFDQLESLDAADALILRHYEVTERDRLALALALRKATRARSVRLLVAGDRRLATAVDADGIHIPSWKAKRGKGEGGRRKPGWIITAAAHNGAELRAAALAGADAALLSPAFATASHPDRTGLGAVRFARLSTTAQIPVYALGGVTNKTAKRLKHVPNLVGWAAVSTP